MLCLTLSFSLYSSNPAANTGASLGDVLKEATHTGAIIAIIGLLERNGYTKSACTLGGVALLSELEKQNPKFFNRTMNTVSAPWIFARKRCENLFCSGESLSWNELITWRTRVMKLLSPLTKQTTVVDLSREKRLRLIDQEDGAEVILDEHWAEYTQHIEKQFTFTINLLDTHLNYYRDKKNKEEEKQKKSVSLSFKSLTINPIAKASSFAGKACIRASVSRNEEIAFYLEEIKTYLQEIIIYTKSVNQLSSLDKDRVKRVMNSTCDAFEHVATLIDANTAASGRNAVGQLTIQRENSGHNYANSYSPYPIG